MPRRARHEGRDLRFELAHPLKEFCGDPAAPGNSLGRGKDSAAIPRRSLGSWKFSVPVLWLEGSPPAVGRIPRPSHGTRMECSIPRPSSASGGGQCGRDSCLAARLPRTRYLPYRTPPGGAAPISRRRHPSPAYRVSTRVPHEPRSCIRSGARIECGPLGISSRTGSRKFCAGSQTRSCRVYDASASG